jgi:hypothetical protein
MFKRQRGRKRGRHHLSTRTPHRGQVRLTVEPLERRDLLSGPSITTLSLPNWTVNQPGYHQTISSTASSAVNFSESGTLPPGLSMVGPQFTNIDNPAAAGDGDTFAYGLSGGKTVGIYDITVMFHGFVYDGTTFTPLDDPLAKPGQTFANGISGNTIVGDYSDGTNFFGFVYDGAFHSFMVPGSVKTILNGISGTKYVGTYSDIQGTHSFVYNASTSTYTPIDDPAADHLMTMANGISGNTVVGDYQKTTGGVPSYHGFIYDGSNYTTIDDPKGVNGTHAEGVSGNNVVGFYVDASNQEHGFYFDGSTYTTIDEPAGALKTDAYGIDGSNIVGTYTDAAVVTHGFAYNMVVPTISGTPTTPGTYTFSVSETDSTGMTGSQSYSVTINPAVAISTTALPVWTAGRSYSQTISAAGGTGSLTFSSSGTLPTGLTLSSAGVLSGTPASAGSFNFQVTATDSVGAASTQSYTVVINPAVQITTTTLPDGTPGAAYSQTLSASGGTGSISFATTSGTLPTGLALSSSGVLSGTPTAPGSYTFTISATDAVGAAGTKTYTVAIGSSAATQLVLTASSTATAGTSFNLTITAEDGGGHTAGSFNNTVTLGSSAGADLSPTSVTLTGGTATVPITLTSAGSQTITATFTGLTSGTATVLVSPGALGQFQVGVPGSSTVQAGSGFLVTVQAEDAYGNPITSYSGPATATSSITPTSAASNFPTSVSIGPSGLGLFLGNLQKVGSYTISVAAGTAHGSAPTPVTVVPGPAVKLGFGVQPMDTPTGLTLPSLTVQVQDLYGNVITGDNTDSVTVAIATGPGPGAPGFKAGSSTGSVVHNGVATFNNLTLTVPGSYMLSAVVPLKFTGPFSAPFHVIPLQVLPGSLAATPAGFSLQFNAPFLVNSVTPVLFGQGFGATAPAASVTLTQIKDAAGNPVSNAVEGSLILNTATNAITFLATNTAYQVNNSSPLLPDGTYQVNVTSSAAHNGFQGLNSGSGFLDGLATGSAGSGDYTTTFTVNAGADDVLWVPATADGPGQVLSAPGNNQIGGGYPVYLNDSTGTVTSAQVTLNYDATLLSVTGVSGTGFTMLASSTPGHAVLQYSVPALPAGSQTPIGYLIATVPGGSIANPTPYKAKDLLHLSGASLNGGAIAVATSDALHMVAYVGDGDGNGSYSSNDAVLLTRVGLQTDTGFTAYPLVDPVIIGDTDGSGFIPADAALQTNEAGVGFTTANLPNPPIPVGVHFQAVANNVDPTLSLPNDLQPGPDGTLTVPVNIDDPHPEGSTGLIEAHLALVYDPHQFSVSAADIRLGSVLAAGSGWSVTPTINAVTGEIAIALSSTAPITSMLGGSLVIIDFHQNPSAPVAYTLASPAAIALVSLVNPTGAQVVTTELQDAQGTFTVSPALGNGSVLPSYPVTAAGAQAADSVSVVSVADVVPSLPQTATSDASRMDEDSETPLSGERQPPERSHSPGPDALSQGADAPRSETGTSSPRAETIVAPLTAVLVVAGNPQPGMISWPHAADAVALPALAVSDAERIFTQATERVPAGSPLLLAPAIDSDNGSEEFSGDRLNWNFREDGLLQTDSPVRGEAIVLAGSTSLVVDQASVDQYFAQFVNEPLTLGDED